MKSVLLITLLMLTGIAGCSGYETSEDLGSFAASPSVDEGADDPFEVADPALTEAARAVLPDVVNKSSGGCDCVVCTHDGRGHVRCRMRVCPESQCH